MSNINVTELRRNLPAYLDQVRRGQRIKVTSCGRVIAEIMPAAPSLDEADAARARRAIQVATKAGTVFASAISVMDITTAVRRSRRAAARRARCGHWVVMP